MKFNKVFVNKHFLPHIKSFYFMLVLSVLFPKSLNSQSDLSGLSHKDSLTWYHYIGGKPDTHRVKAAQKIARLWGLRTEYFYGDCGGTYDYKAKEFEEKNMVVYAYLTNKFGSNWEDKFNEAVEKELKH